MSLNLRTVSVVLFIGIQLSQFKDPVLYLQLSRLREYGKSLGMAPPPVK